jgi:hypothetical protein
LEASAVRALVISMIETTFRARAVARLRSGAGHSVALVAAVLTAVALTAIVVTTDVKDLTAPGAAARS